MVNVLTCSSMISIHTPTKGVTSTLTKIQLEKLNFNPHSHEGSDENMKATLKSIRISIHTPTKGVTL